MTFALPIARISLYGRRGHIPVRDVEVRRKFTVHIWNRVRKPPVYSGQETRPPYMEVFVIDDTNEFPRILKKLIVT